MLEIVLSIRSCSLLLVACSAILGILFVQQAHPILLEKSVDLSRNQFPHERWTGYWSDIINCILPWWIFLTEQIYWQMLSLAYSLKKHVTSLLSHYFLSACKNGVYDKIYCVLNKFMTWNVQRVVDVFGLWHVIPVFNFCNCFGFWPAWIWNTSCE